MNYKWFSIRNQLLLLAALATGSIWTGAFVQYRQLQNQSVRLAKVQSDLDSALALSLAARMVAQERGLSNGWLLAVPPRPVADLKEVRDALDAALGDLRQHDHAGSDVAVTALARDLLRYRGLADRRDIAPATLFNWYSSLISAQFDRSNKDLAMGMIEVGLAYEHVGHLMWATEYLAQLRGMIYGVLTHGSGSAASHQDIMRALTLHLEYRNMFERSAPVGTLQVAGVELNRPALRNSLELTERFLRTGDVNALGVTPQAWWIKATEAVDTMKKLSERESNQIKITAHQRIAQIQHQMWMAVATLLVLGVITLGLVLATVGRIVRGLSTLLNGLEEVAIRRNLNSRIEDQSHDEFGQISRGVNKLVEMASHVVDEHELKSMTDVLTGVLNRRGLDMQMVARANPNRKQRMALSLLMLDLDHFKSINDTFGHPAGDSVLSQLAKLLQQIVRPDDVVARYGGEEFVVLLSGCLLPEALTVAEVIRAKVESHNFGLGVTVTISIGAAEQGDLEIPLALMMRADEAMYRSKTTGRNRVSAANALAAI